MSTTATPTTGPDTPRSARAAVTCCDWLVSFSSHKSCSSAAKDLVRHKEPERAGLHPQNRCQLVLGLSRNWTPRRCPMIFAMLATDQCDVAWWWGPGAMPRLPELHAIRMLSSTGTVRHHGWKHSICNFSLPLLCGLTHDVADRDFVWSPHLHCLVEIGLSSCNPLLQLFHAIGDVTFSPADALGSLSLHHRWLCDFQQPLHLGNRLSQLAEFCFASTGGGGENCCICFNASNRCSASRMFVLTVVRFASNSVRCARARDKNPSHSLISTSTGCTFTSFARFRAARKLSTSGPSTPCRAAKAASSFATRSCPEVTLNCGSPNGRVPDVFATGLCFGWGRG